MSAHRNPRRRKRIGRTLDGSPFRAPIAFAGRVDAHHAINGNENRGKRHAASMDYAGRIAEAVDRSRETYSPLTVVTPLPDSLGRKSRSRSRYTI